MGLFNSKNTQTAQEIIWSEVLIDAYKDNTKRLFDFGCNINQGSMIILTNDNKVVITKKKYGETNTLNVVDISDIMKIELNIVMKNKTRASMFALVPTYETISKIDYMELKIITFDKIHRFYLENLGSNIIDYADDLEILATYLQRKVNNNKF